MSDDLESTDVVMMCCASCGKADVDDVKLKKCGCKLVRYCSVECQKNHRPQHKNACKKRMAELRDDLLFTQPDGSHLGECPICFLPLSLDRSKSAMLIHCCSKIICNGCVHANYIRQWEGGLEETCPFCRKLLPETDEEIDRNNMQRAKANDPNALYQVGCLCYDDEDYEGAFENWTKAAGLGDMMAHSNISVLYGKGQGVEKNKKKEIYHLEEAAIGGHPKARYNLALEEGRGRRYDRATKHLIIAAKLGYDDALNKLKEYFAKGLVSKEGYASALRGHQAAVDATKSEQRDAAEE